MYGAVSTVAHEVSVGMVHGESGAALLHVLQVSSMCSLSWFIVAVTQVVTLISVIVASSGDT